MNDASIEETVVVSNNQQEKENEVVTEKKTLKLKRYYTDGIVHPFDICEWTNSKVEIKNTEGNVIFSQDVEHPVHWDSMAVRVCADKYFKSHDLENHPHGGERSVKDVIHRVCWSIATRAKSMDYVDEESQKILYEELCYIILNQIAAFNSPVFFNWGLYDVYKFKGNSKANRWAIKDRDGEVFKQEYEYENPQGSACKSADTMLHVVECDKLNYDSPIILIEIRIDQLTNLFHMNHNFFVTSDRGLVKVLAAKNNGIKKTFKINFEEGSLRITEDDQVFVKKEEEQWICVKDLLNNYKEYKLNHMYKNWVNIDSIEEFEEEQVYAEKG